MTSRREFLGMAALACAGCTDTLRATFTRAAVTTVATGPKRVAELTALSAEPTAFAVMTADGGDTVYAYTEGEQVVVLSNLCTHRGCPVSWEKATSHFTCPCHGGVFDAHGQVLDGPPLGPLLRYTPDTRDGVVYING